MLQAVILFCALGRDPVTCTQDTALYRYEMPAPSIFMCAFTSETSVAAVHPIFGREYEKVVCRAR